ncbi:unnamed protein product, partial [Urochloa humidicola]
SNSNRLFRVYISLEGRRRRARHKVVVMLVMSKLAGKKRNALRIVAVPGTIECVVSLLHATSDEECNHFGLLVIKKLDAESRRRVWPFAAGVLDSVRVAAAPIHGRLKRGYNNGVSVYFSSFLFFFFVHVIQNTQYQ